MAFCKTQVVHETQKSSTTLQQSAPGNPNSVLENNWWFISKTSEAHIRIQLPIFKFKETETGLAIKRQSSVNFASVLFFLLKGLFKKAAFW